MRCETIPQYAIVTADSAKELTERLNAKLQELMGKRPKVTFEGLTAHISYMERAEIVEDLADEYELEGVKLTCQDCPMFKPILKRDGTRDSRTRWGDCPLCRDTFGRTARDSRACKTLFQMINSGEVKLCLAESEQ